MPKNYLDENVYIAAKNRILDIFNTFPKLYLAFSGGKDSTVMLHLALEIAEAENRLPLDVLFVD
ncbi:MAG: phosphoadenosine phosphosulfate reductase family protein [Algibacter sp.]